MLLSKSHDSSSNSVADVPSIGKRDLFNALPLLGITVIDADSDMDERSQTSKGCAKPSMYSRNLAVSPQDFKFSILRQYRSLPSFSCAVKIYANFAPDKMIDMDGRIDGRAAKRKGRESGVGVMHK